MRRSRLVKPLGSSRKAHKTDSRACTPGLVMGIPAVRVPAGLIAGAVRAVRSAGRPHRHMGRARHALRDPIC